VLIVDDHRMFAQAISLLLRAEANFEVFGIAHTGEAAVRACRGGCPTVVLMDIHLPGMDGIQTTRKLLEICPDTRVVVVSGISDAQVISEALEAGASAYIPKTELADKVIGIIRKAAGGQMVHLPPTRRPAPEDLTQRELEVLQAVAEGMSTTQVARWLFVSPSTVRSHVKSILMKLGVHSKLAAVVEGARRGLIGVVENGPDRPLPPSGPDRPTPAGARGQT